MDIKFRAWMECEKALAFFDFDDIFGGEFDSGSHIPDGDMVMQFTGLKDINGTDIYAGDILHQLDPVVWNPFAVEYSNVTARFLAGGSLSQSEINNNELVIIGNIFENKELLKSVK